MRGVIRDRHLLDTPEPGRAQVVFETRQALAKMRCPALAVNSPRRFDDTIFLLKHIYVAGLHDLTPQFRSKVNPLQTVRKRKCTCVEVTAL